MKKDEYDDYTRMTSIERGIEQVIGGLDPSGTHARLQSGAAAAWREVAGASVAAHAVGVYVRGRQLVVEMDSPAWASDIAFFADQYRDAVNEYLGERAVDTVRITVQRRRRT